MLEENNSPLGKTVFYKDTYDKNLLFPLPRKKKRIEIGITDSLPFNGFDIWNAYEISWLNVKGKPEVALAEIIIPCETPYLIESKSFKLYFNSFNQTCFPSIDAVKEILIRDLAEAVQGNVNVNIMFIRDVPKKMITSFSGICLDTLDIICDTYSVEPRFLKIEDEEVIETLYSDLLKSNCLVTGQPDWASVQIMYKGKKISHESLLQYLISFRQHNEFHEQCIERIFIDIMQHCHPQELTVYGRYTRRGGLDINPIRSTHLKSPQNIRLCRQ